MLRISMSPISSSTLMHQVLRLKVRWRRKFIGSISYSADHSTISLLSLELCRTRESRSTTRVWVYNHRVFIRAVSNYSATSRFTQLKWIGALSMERSCDEYAIKGSMFPISMFSNSLALAIRISDAASVWVKKRKLLTPTIREA